MASNPRGSKSGAELLHELEIQAALELRKTRLLVEEACATDIETYWRGSGLGDISVSGIKSLLTPSIAGGRWGFNNLIARLDKLEVVDNEQETIANELLDLAAPHAKVLNYSRFRSGAIQSYVELCSKTKMETSVKQLPDLVQTKLNRMVRKVTSDVITDIETLDKWAADVEEIMETLSVEQEKAIIDRDAEIIKGKKGIVSTKSISSYSKHWFSFVEEKISKYFGEKPRFGLSESVSAKSDYLVNYEAKNWTTLQKQLQTEQSTRRRVEFGKKKQDSNIKPQNSKLLTEELQFNGRKLRLTYNLIGLDGELVRPAVNILRGQLIRDPKSKLGVANVTTETGTLLIELEKPAKSDLVDLEILLNSRL